MHLFYLTIVPAVWVVSYVISRPSPGSSESSTLFAAVASGDVDLVRTALQNLENDVNMLDATSGSTPLCAAVFIGRTEITESPITLLWLIPLTMLPPSFMAAGSFGPDSSIGRIPIPQESERSGKLFPARVPETAHEPVGCLVSAGFQKERRCRPRFSQFQFPAGAEITFQADVFEAWSVQNQFLEAATPPKWPAQKPPPTGVQLVALKPTRSVHSLKMIEN